AGGLVGLNLGTITSTTQPGAAASCTTGASFSCASGSVSVTAFGQGGGLVGSNQGTIASSFATGAVIGGPGGLVNGLQVMTDLGGLAGINLVTITNSHASGNVGTAGVAYLQAGGLVGDNSGTILGGSASGDVRVGDHSEAGGLVAANGALTGSCIGCTIG